MPPHRYSRQDVITAALDLLNKEGLDAVTVRGVARRMHVNVNTVSFHVGTKARLLGLMSDEVLTHLSLEDLPDNGLDRVREILRRYRKTLLMYRDGARLTAGNAPFEEHTLELTEELVSSLSAAGVPDTQCALGMWALFYYLLGITQEQQGSQYHPAAETAPASDRYPTLHRLRGDIFSEDFDRRYEFGVEAVLARLSVAAEEC